LKYLGGEVSEENPSMKKGATRTLSVDEEWALMTPVSRYVESQKLWAVYLGLGGSLDPQPDSQSPFDFPELERAVPADGRAGVHFVRRRG